MILSAQHPQIPLSARREISRTPNLPGERRTLCDALAWTQASTGLVMRRRMTWVALIDPDRADILQQRVEIIVHQRGTTR